ncbi:MAG: lipocalin family protein [Bacteroidota bacterium]
MKSNFLVVSLLAVVVFLSSCGKDDNTNQLSGTYKITSLTSENCNDPDDNINFQFDDDGCFTEQNIEICIDGTWVFNDGNYTVTFAIEADGFSIGGSESDSGTYTIEGSRATLCPMGEDCGTATIRFDGDTFTISDIDDDDGCDVTMVATKI